MMEHSPHSILRCSVRLGWGGESGHSGKASRSERSWFSKGMRSYFHPSEKGLLCWPVYSSEMELR